MADRARVDEGTRTTMAVAPHEIDLSTAARGGVATLLAAPVVPARPAVHDEAPGSAAVLSALARRLDARTATVAVGLGYVGLPLLLAAADAGHPVIGLDVSAAKVADLSVGRSYITDIPDAELAVLTGSTLTTDAARLGEADVVLLAVPTPLSDGSPDLRPVREATEALAAVMRPGTLVVLESTTWPGTTEEVLLPILEAGGLRAGADFALAYSPERIDPGSQHSFAATPKLIAGVTPACTRLAGQFYSAIVSSVVVAKSPRDAEMAKLIENTFRQVNIALVNELATVAPALGVDIWAALDAASTKPFGFMPFWPGPGVGGHCIAVDPSYLSWRAEQQLGYGVGFIEHARSVNNRMPAYVVSRVAEVLNRSGAAVRGSRVHLLGLAYKAGVNDPRESPAIAVAERLLADGASLSYTDEYLPTVRVSGVTLPSTPLSDELLDDVDVAVVLTAHPGVDYAALLARARVVFDATGTLRGHAGALADGRLVLL